MAMETDAVEKVVILGSGPAGLTAAVYTARANLRPLVFHGETPGGQLTTTSEVENYPGFVHGVDGNSLLDAMQKQAERFGARFQFGTANSVDFSKRPLELYFGATEADRKVVRAHSVIIATGASPRLLDIPTLKTYWAKGVTTCATCDGHFFKKQDVCVIGGGDSAMEEASYLTRMCNKVYLIHRRDTFRASKIMSQRALANPKIEAILDSGVEEVLGDESGKVSGVRVKNYKTGEERNISLKGVFVAIGHIPNTAPFAKQVPVDENGYFLHHADSTKTATEGVFVAGDSQDHVFRQAITAAGSGCMAAIEAERWLEEHSL